MEINKDILNNPAADINSLPRIKEEDFIWAENILKEYGLDKILDKENNEIKQ